MTRLRAGLVGLGTVGRHHARVLGDLRGVEFVGAIDPDPQARDAARFHHSTSIFNDNLRFILLVAAGTGVKITNDGFMSSDNANIIMADGAAQNVTISHNIFKATDAPPLDYLTIYTAAP